VAEQQGRNLDFLVSTRAAASHRQLVSMVIYSLKLHLFAIFWSTIQTRA
jgi:preprotein translocase subunit SecY